MNVLESIKTLQHDLATGFKSLTTGGAERKSSVAAPAEAGTSGQLQAGAGLLNRFQTQWTKLHQDAEENATVAGSVDQQVTDLYLRLERENHAVTQLVAELTSIPQLLYTIQQSMDMIGEIEVHCSELDVAFEDLRDVCRECELRSNKQRHEYQLSLYQQRRELELEQNKVQLAMKHACTVERYEARLQATLREKQQACEAASKQEMEHYRLHGHAQLKPSPPTESHVELADISLEQDKTELDAFLRSDTDTGENDTPSVELTRSTTADVTENGGAQLNVDVSMDDTGQHNEVMGQHNEVTGQDNEVKDIDGPNSEPGTDEDQHLNDTATTE